MMDREIIIKGCEYWVNNHKGEDLLIEYSSVVELLALLKEQETTFENDGHHIMCKSCGAYWCGMDQEGDRYPQNFCPNCGKMTERSNT